MDYISHKQLLDFNGDCKVCAGDCPMTGCSKPIQRICGQGIEGRGCGTQHVKHELFCPQAATFMAVSLKSAVRGCDGQVNNNQWG